MAAARIRGRATTENPANRFEAVRMEVDTDHLVAALDDDLPRQIKTEFFADQGKTLIRENSSPDLSFRYSVNPYRGCEHGCAYCYARPGHETLGLGAGIDFETKILVKQSAANILRRELNHPRWEGESITLSGVTDCYQPIERQLQLTRSLIDVFVEARQAFGIVTKNALVTRDLDLLRVAAERQTVHVFVSINSLRQDLVRKLEPRTSAPASRLAAVRQLADAGVPVGVMVAPVIPGINDEEVPAVLQAAAKAGARSAATILVRLPWSVRPVFENWLSENVSTEQAGRVKNRIRDTRDGKMNDANFGSRMRGSGPYAEALRATFDAFSKRYGLDSRLPPLDTAQFRAPTDSSGQRRLF